MTWAMFAVGYLDVGSNDLAYSNFVRGYANVQQPFQVWRETPTGGAINFLTGAGGFLQSVIFGYGGLRLPTGDKDADAGLELNPPPPPAGATAAGQASAFVLHGLDYRGNSLRVRTSARQMDIELLPPAQKGGFSYSHSTDADVDAGVGATIELEVVSAQGKSLGDLTEGGPPLQVPRQRVFVREKPQ